MQGSLEVNSESMLSCKCLNLDLWACVVAHLCLTPC